MTLRARITAAVALALFVGVGIGVPVVDAALYHADAEHASSPHVESAEGPDCHTERCALGAPVAPAPLALGLGIHPRYELPGHASAGLIYHAPLDRTPARSPGSRAPPA